MTNRPQRSPFGPTPQGENFRRNAVQVGHPFEDDAFIGFGYVAAGDALIQHWLEHGPNDGLLLPMIWNYRHGLELLLKAAIRDAARCVRDNGDPDAKVAEEPLNEWLARGAGHSLEALANRLDDYLTRLGLENLLPETKSTLVSLHTLDPGGDTFRYATSWNPATKRLVPTKRPNETHIDVVVMGEAFHDAATLIGGGILSLIDEYRDYRASMGP
jgi:hypothetical protein